MATIHTINAGDKVTGSYIGVLFSGTVTSHRPHTMNHRIELFNVALDQPIDVLGLVRDSLHMAASDDSAALARYNGTDTGDFIKVAR